MVTGNLTIEDAKVVFRNFSGEEQKYNRAGDRNFCVLLDPDLASVLKNDGWAVKFLKPRDEEESPQAYLQVKVSFDNIPPRVVLVTSRNKKNLSEEDVGLLDWAELDHVDLIIRPYNWNVNGKTGIKAYLKTGYFTIAEDEFAARYEGIPEE